MTDTSATTTPPVTEAVTLRAWPLTAALAGLLGSAATLFLDTRAGNTEDLSYTVSAADMAALDHQLFRIGGFVGYLAVAALLVFAAVWHRRVTQRYTWSLGAPLVTYGTVAGAGILTLAYGWKGAIGNYAQGAAEAGTYDDEGLYNYYILNDFSPFIGWTPVAVALGGLAYMAFRERLVSRALGAVVGLITVAAFGAVALTGVPGLPFVASVGLLIAGVWLSVGRNSAITREHG